MTKTDLRKGFTTGTCAAAASKAAAMALGSKDFETEEIIMVEVSLPNGDRVKLKASLKALGEDYTVASVVKDAGDDPDVTDGAEIVVTVRLLESTFNSQRSTDRDNNLEAGGNILIKGGSGVGVVTKPGLQISVGEPAINPVPRRMIAEAIKEVLPDKAVEVTVEVPKGVALAKKTFNPRLGIVGGISIIGTTGIVESMSLEALKATVRCEIDVAIEESGVSSYSRGELYLAPGKIGEDSLKRLLGPVRVVQTSNFIGFALEYAREKGVRDIVLGGHPGKLAKILMGYYDTHSKNSPQATDFVAVHLGVSEKFNTVEEIIEKTKASSESDFWSERFSHLARDIAGKIVNDFGFSTVTVYLFDMKKQLIGEGKWVG